ncbi:MAG: hypothetical protein Q7T55_13950 [Solirubrobacteraceae bacterium]|nr:hypothetical protein [Solirubrobacteraceae bacterium]
MTKDAERRLLSCACGAVRVVVEGTPIASVECCCTTCSEASSVFEGLRGAGSVRTSLGTTAYVLCRKDRVTFETGTDGLVSHRLTPDATSRRVLAECCNTPLFLEFNGGHWLSMYAALWPEGSRPAVQERTMTRSLPDRSVLPADVPNPKRHTVAFYARLLRAWAQMGFRSPSIEIERTIDA